MAGQSEWAGRQARIAAGKGQPYRVLPSSARVRSTQHTSMPASGVSSQDGCAHTGGCADNRGRHRAAEGDSCAYVLGLLLLHVLRDLALDRPHDLDGVVRAIHHAARLVRMAHVVEVSCRVLPCGQRQP